MCGMDGRAGGRDGARGNGWTQNGDASKACGWGGRHDGGSCYAKVLERRLGGCSCSCSAGASAAVLKLCSLSHAGPGITARHPAALDLDRTLSSAQREADVGLCLRAPTRAGGRRV